jgi:predicted MFS family arabinose efflux permease
MLTERSGSSNRWLALGILALLAVFNYVDRIILALLQVPIQHEFNLSDAQMGSLTGLAFAVFYTGLGLPIARLADRTVRKYVIAAALVVWSCMTAMMGLATGFGTLLLLRIGVAIGEAGLVPATHSMISDLFARERRATALSLWGMSAPIGTMVGLFGAGWMGEALGWRHAFLVFGLIGVTLAPLFLATVREPQRGNNDPMAQRADAVPPLLDSLKMLWNLKSFRYVVIAGALNVYVLYAMKTWNAPFYVRAHGMTLGAVGTSLALATGIGGAIGTFAGGTIADVLGRRFARGNLVPPMLGMLLIVPLGVMQYTSASVRVSMFLSGATIACGYLYFATIVSTSMSMVPGRLRALTSSVIVLVVNLIGMGLGPLVTGAISDLLGADSAGESLRISLILALLPALAAAGLYWLANNAMVRELPARAVPVPAE